MQRKISGLMMKNDNDIKKIIREYVRNISALLPVSSNESKQFLRSLQSKIVQSIENDELHTYDELLGIYGTPCDIASCYLRDLDFESTSIQLKKKHFIRCILSLCSTLVIFGGIIGIYLVNAKYKEGELHILNMRSETTIIEIPVSDTLESSDINPEIQQDGD